MKTAQKTTTKKNAASTATATKKQPSKSPAPQKSSSEEATGLRELFEDSLKDIYWAEKALTKALPKMAKKTTTEELLTALNDHLAVTQQQVTRLEEVFGILGLKAQAKKCEAMEGLIKEANEIMESTEEGVVRDAGIILAGQKVEHYEIATYGTLTAFAKILGETEAADLLHQSLAEEKEADEKLTEVAEGHINVDAAAEDGEGEEEEHEEA